MLARLSFPKDDFNKHLENQRSLAYGKRCRITANTWQERQRERERHWNDTAHIIYGYSKMCSIEPSIMMAVYKQDGTNWFQPVHITKFGKNGFLIRTRTRVPFVFFFCSLLLLLVLCSFHSIRWFQVSSIHLRLSWVSLFALCTLGHCELQDNSLTN